MNRFALLDKIGDGGYSSVHRCTDSLGIRYVCKVLPKHTNKRVRVQREIEIMRRLSFSPKVPRLIEACEDDTSFYIVQEWCRGGAVREYMSSYDMYAENTVASMIRGILRGLAHIHGAGIIHRDIKASNILLADKSEDADVKIGDFGAAIQFEFDVVEVDEVVGTPWFMPPESLNSLYTTKSDVWSLGVMTYQLLSGRMPFNDRESPLSPSVAKIWNSILHDNPKFQGSAWSNVSQEAKDFVKVCLQKSYKERPTAAEALAHPWLTMSDCNNRFTGTPLRVRPFRYEDTSLMNARTYQTNDETRLQ